MVQIFVAPGSMAISGEWTNSSKLLSQRKIPALFLCAVLPMPLKILVQ